MAFPVGRARVKGAWVALHAPKLSALALRTAASIREERLALVR
jgi:hypothetical protein